MNIKGKPGSKERLLEIFQGVNKIQITEKVDVNKPPINEGVDNSNRDSVINYYTFMLDDDEIRSNPILQQKLQKYFSMSKEDLNQLSNEELQLIWDTVAQADQESIEEIDNKDESDPFGGARQEFQDGPGYGDEKPVNPELRTDAPELDKFVKEEPKKWGESGKFKDVDGVMKWSDDVETPEEVNEVGFEAGEGNGRVMSPHEAEMIVKAVETLHAKNLPINVDNIQKEFQNIVGLNEEDDENEESSNEFEKTPEQSLDPNDEDNNGDYIRGGLADDSDSDDYNPEQILKRIEVEMEHTDDPRVALEIAMDHLEEIPDYYTRLDSMEKDAEIDKSEEPHESGAYIDDGMPGELDRNGNPIPAIDPHMGGMIPFNIEDMPDDLRDHGEVINNVDKDLEDVLLGYDTNTPNNVEEEQSFASREVEYADMEAYKRYQELDAKGFDNLSPEEKEEFYELWLEFGR